MSWRVALEIVNAVALCAGVIFAAYQLWTRKHAALAAAPKSSDRIGFLLGMGSGFTSQIAHAGLPPYQMWVLRKKLKPATFIGTTAIFFAIVEYASGRRHDQPVSPGGARSEPKAPCRRVPEGYFGAEQALTKAGSGQTPSKQPIVLTALP